MELEILNKPAGVFNRSPKFDCVSDGVAGSKICARNRVGQLVGRLKFVSDMLSRIR